MSTFETANLLAILSAGRVPSWVEQSSFTGTPASDSDGADLGNAILALVSVDIRAKAHRRAALVTATHDAATTYTVTINGTAHAVATPADLDALMTDMRDAINAGAQASAVTATALDSSGDDVATSGNPATQLRIIGDNDADWYVDISVSGGSGTIACVADPTSATLRIWQKFRAATNTTAPGSWRALKLDGANYDLTLSRMGHVERYSTAGLSRFFVELDSIAGHASDGASVTYADPTVTVGPCIQE